jgi:hypothetical protein
VAARTAATSSRGTGPRPPGVVVAVTRPVPGSSVSEPGRTIVHASPLARRAASAAALASRYGRMASPADVGAWAPMDETIT